jgi:hypothetical protein
MYPSKYRRECLPDPGSASICGAHQKRCGCCELGLSADILKPPKKSLDLSVTFPLLKLGSTSPSTPRLERDRNRIGQGASLRTDSFQFGKLQSIRSTSFVHYQRKDYPRRLLRAIKVHLPSSTEDCIKVEIASKLGILGPWFQCGRPTATQRWTVSEPEFFLPYLRRFPVLRKSIHRGARLHMHWWRIFQQSPCLVKIMSYLRVCAHS